MGELNISVVIMQENMLISGEIYTTGKNFTLPPAVTAVTNLTSVRTYLLILTTTSDLCYMRTKVVNDKSEDPRHLSQCSDLTRAPEK